MSLSKIVKSKSARSGQHGFTLVELMIASSVFSVILLTAAGIVVQFTHSYQKGLIDSSTQNVARSILDTISQSVEFGGANPSPIGSPVSGYCINGTRYSFQRGMELQDDVSTALTEEKGMNPSCDPASIPVTKQEMLSPHMRLSSLDVRQVGSSTMWTVTVKVAYGDNEVFEGGAAGARGTDPACDQEGGSQWCAVRELSATVQRKI